MMYFSSYRPTNQHAPLMMGSNFTSRDSDSSEHPMQNLTANDPAFFRNMAQDIPQSGPCNTTMNGQVMQVVAPMYPSQPQNSATPLPSGQVTGHHYGPASSSFINYGMTVDNYIGTQSQGSPMYTNGPNYASSASIQVRSNEAPPSTADSMASLEANFWEHSQNLNVNPMAVEYEVQHPRSLCDMRSHDRATEIYNDRQDYSGVFQATSSFQGQQPPVQQPPRQLFTRNAPEKGRIAPFNFKKAVKKASQMTEVEQNNEINLLYLKIQAINEAKDKMDRANGKVTKFWKFTELPTELQIKIWKIAVPQPRTLIVEAYHPTRYDKTQMEDRVRFRCFSSPQAMLRACKISREVILPSFDTCIKTDGSARAIRFHGAEDTLVLLGITKILTAKTADLEMFSKIHGLGIQQAQFIHKPVELPNLIKAHLKSVRTIAVFSNDGTNDTSRVTKMRDNVALFPDDSRHTSQMIHTLATNTWPKEYYFSNSIHKHEKAEIEIKGCKLVPLQQPWS